MKLKTQNIAFYLFVLIQVVNIQFSTHHVETLDWDVNAFLVTGLEYGRGNLPYEFQYENKPPLLFLIFYFFSLITNSNLFYIKIINDILILLILIMMSNLYKKSVDDVFSRYTPPLLFLLFTSNVWFHPNYSEYLVIVFLALAQIFNHTNLKSQNILIGFSVGLASLINIGSSLFLISFLLIINLEKGLRLFKTITLILGFSIPHILFLTAYWYNNLLEEYIMATVHVPLSYTNSDFSFTYALTVFLTALKNYDLYIYSLLLISIAFLIYKTFRNTIYKINEPEHYEILILCISSLLFFYVAGKGYYHHLILFLYFISFTTKWISKNLNKLIIILIIFISLIGANMSAFQMTKTNLRNFDNIQSNYPIYQIASNLKSKISTNEIIFSTHNILLLYYLDKPNSSYIVHPALYDYEEITSELKLFKKVANDEIKNNIQKSPKIIELSNDEFISGDYIKLKTDNVNKNLLNYWSKDPPLNIYIKK